MPTGPALTMTSGNVFNGNNVNNHYQTNRPKQGFVGAPANNAAPQPRIFSQPPPMEAFSNVTLPKQLAPPLEGSITLEHFIDAVRAAQSYDDVAHLMPLLPRDVASLVQTEMADCSFDVLSTNLENLYEVIHPRSVYPAYLSTVCQSLLDTEKSYVTQDYFNNNLQNDITPRMRGILIDWLVDVCCKYNLSHETFHLTISLIDRFLNHQRITRRELQLVGVGALFIAAKFEEVYPPEINDYVFVAAKTYSKHEIMRMERFILTMLQFRIAAPSSSTFAAFILAEQQPPPSPDQQNFVEYLLQSFLVAQPYIQLRPSMLAAAACHLSREAFGIESVAPPPNIMQCLDMIRQVVNETCGADSKLTAVRRKFATDENHRVSTIPIPGSDAHHVDACAGTS